MGYTPPPCRFRGSFARRKRSGGGVVFVARSRDERGREAAYGVHAASLWFSGLVRERGGGVRRRHTGYTPPLCGCGGSSEGWRGGVGCTRRLVSVFGSDVAGDEETGGVLTAWVVDELAVSQTERMRRCKPPRSLGSSTFCSSSPSRSSSHPSPPPHLPAHPSSGCGPPQPSLGSLLVMTWPRGWPFRSTTSRGDAHIPQRGEGRR
jgi:hypothetical protein